MPLALQNVQCIEKTICTNPGNDPITTGSSNNGYLRVRHELRLIIKAR